MSLSVQRLVKPSVMVKSTIAELYFRGEAEEAGAGLIIRAGNTVSTETYFNSFSVEKWRQKTFLNSVDLILTTTGRCKISVRHKTEFGETILFDQSREGTVTTKTPIVLDALRFGIVFWVIEALTDSFILTSYTALTPPPRPVFLAIIVTAFQRDDEIKATIDRFKKTDLTEHHRLLIIDNGGTLTAGRYQWGEIIQSPNLGGAGGFTRGLLEARRDKTFTHALFMDDDAFSQVECLERAINFLAWAKTPSIAISGAMLISEEPWLQHEAGAQFGHPYGVRARFALRDMRDKSNVLANEGWERVDYGGWWFFAFALSWPQVLAFPFFVRGDDQLFSLQNAFDVVTLNGVACWQSRFDDKINPSSEYLATRAEILIGLLRIKYSALDRLRLGIAAASPIVREALGFRYGIAHARCDAFGDVLQGPTFWYEPNAIPRLSKLRQLYSFNYPTKLERQLPPEVSLSRHIGLRGRLFRLLTLGGHLFPTSLLRRERCVTFPALYPSAEVFLRSEVVYYSPRLKAGFVARKSLFKFIRVVWRLTSLVATLTIKGKQLKLDYERALPDLQSEVFWRKNLRM